MTVMTKELAPQGDFYDPDEDLDDERHHPFFADPAEVMAETYPSLKNISVGFIVNRVARALEPVPPEYVTLPLKGGVSDAGHLVAVAKWNLLRESVQFRRRYFDDDELPPEVAQIADQGDVNVTFVPRTATRTTNTRRSITSCHGRRRNGTVCLSSVPGSGPTRPTSINRTGICPRTSVPASAGRGHRLSGGISVPDRP
jgi:hypothetical protein